MYAFKDIVKNALPHGIVTRVIRSQAVRHRRIAALPLCSGAAVKYSYQDSIEFLCSRGLPRDHVVNGSIPKTSLDFCATHLGSKTLGDKPLIGLHVGNFLGVSLAYFVDFARKINPDSMVASVDPNLTHRGIKNPQEHVVALLIHFELQHNAMISVGYSGTKSVSNDGVAFLDDSGDEYDPFTKHASEQSCENSVRNLSLLSVGRFDFAVMDGNHDAKYLHIETDTARALLVPGGSLILDDVDDSWVDIKAEFGKLGESGWSIAGTDGRVGILTLPR